MSNKIKNMVVTSVFVAFIAVLAVLSVARIFNPVERSEAERRPLAQFPSQITWEGIVDKNVINAFEKANVDQFPFREFFRSVKANFQYNILGLKENNGLALEDGYIVKIEQDFIEGNLDYSIGKLQAYYEKLLKDNGGKHYVSIIPDKNYFLGQNSGYPAPNYAGLTDKVTSALSGMQYIDIFGKLQLEDYYRTDTHWSQDKIGDVVDAIANAMGFADRLSGKYTENKLEGFKGVYHGQSALNPTPDTLVYLTNEILNGCTVFDYEANATTTIYNLDKFTGSDGYDVFLSGTKPLLRIDNPNATTDKTLVIFRDSFGSSITPLFAEAYASIYVVDIRYIDAGMLTLYEKMGKIDFEGADVLFLYSALILNSRSFK